MSKIPCVHYFINVKYGDDATARQDDPDAPFKTMTAVARHIVENKPMFIALMEYRDGWHMVGAES